MDCLGTYFTHAQTCNVTRVQSAPKWTASVFTHAQTCNVTLVFKVLRNGLPPYLHMPKSVM